MTGGWRFLAVGLAALLLATVGAGLGAWLAADLIDKELGL